MLSLQQRGLWVLDLDRQGERLAGRCKDTEPWERRPQQVSSPATLRPLWIRTVGTETRMAGEGRGPGCVLGGKGGRAGLKPGSTEVLRGSLTSYPACLGWKRYTKGTSGSSWRKCIGL